MTIFLVREEDNMGYISGIFFDYDKAKAFKKKMGSYYLIDEFTSNDEPEIERFIMIQDNGSHELKEAF